MAKISVVIPVYNAEKFLRRCIDSVLAQTLKDIEIICVNDGSTDSSATILNEYAKLENVKIVNQVNSGLSVSRNTGLENASSDYVAFLDSDDFVDADFYEKLFDNIEKHGADIACASIVRENGKKKSYLIDYRAVELANSPRERFLLADCPNNNFVWNKLYRKDFLNKNNLKFVAGMIYEDMWFTPDVLEKAETIVSVPNTYYHYWKHNDNMIKCSCDKYSADKLLGYHYLIEKCKKYNVIPYLRPELQFKREYRIFGISVLKEYSYRATKKFYLFDLIPIFEIFKGI